jgi:hypothetical protein
MLKWRYNNNTTLMKKHKKKPSLILLVIALAIVVFGCFYFNYRLPGTPKVNQVPVENKSLSLSEVINNIQSQQIKEENEKFSIEIYYPKTGLDYVDSEIKSFADESIKSFKDSITNDQSTIDNKYSLYVDYSSQKEEENLLSFKFLISEYTGGVHPNSSDATFVFDFINKKKLTLRDLFTTDAYLQKISDLATAQLKARNISDDAWISAGAGPDPENYKNFTVAENSIIFYFAPYQVASYAEGEQVVEIPFTQIKDILYSSLFSYTGQVAQQETGISLDSLKSGAKISSPLNVTGTINGNGWIGFEGQAGRVELLDSNDNPLAVSSLSAITEWTQLPVKFRAVLTFLVPQGATSGKLVFYNENPSGMISKDLQFTLPIIFK